MRMRFCPLCSGSSGNATYIEAGETRLLVDAGLSAKRITALLEEIGVSPAQLDAVLITHEHTDHVSGVDVLCRRHDLPVYANAACFMALRERLAKIPAGRRFVFEPDHDFFIGQVCIFPFTTYHDAAHPVGFTFTWQGKKCAVCTDIGHVDGRVLEALERASVLLLECNHDVDMLMAGQYPYMLKQRILSGHGHLCNEDCGHALVRLYAAGVKHAILGHLSRENNYPPLALATVRGVLAEAGVDMGLVLAERDMPTGIFEIA